MQQKRKARNMKNKTQMPVTITENLTATDMG